MLDENLLQKYPRWDQLLNYKLVVPIVVKTNNIDFW
jgi:hypothetical protein